jgi:hypothetical protein
LSNTEISVINGSAGVDTFVIVQEKNCNRLPILKKNIYKKTLYLFAPGDCRIIYVCIYVVLTHNNVPIYIYIGIYKLYGNTTQDI